MSKLLFSCTKVAFYFLDETNTNLAEDEEADSGVISERPKQDTSEPDVQVYSETEQPQNQTPPSNS